MNEIYLTFLKCCFVYEYKNIHPRWLIHTIFTQNLQQTAEVCDTQKIDASTGV